MSYKVCATLSLALMVLAGPSFAQEATIDVNADGMYSLPELQAVDAAFSEETFMLLDVSGDGLLDAEEIAAGTEAGLLPVTEG
jgi:hypothetical protein